MVHGMVRARVTGSRTVAIMAASRVGPAPPVSRHEQFASFRARTKAHLEIEETAHVERAKSVRVSHAVSQRINRQATGLERGALHRWTNTFKDAAREEAFQAYCFQYLPQAQGVMRVVVGLHVVLLEGFTMRPTE